MLCDPLIETVTMQSAMFRSFDRVFLYRHVRHFPRCRHVSAVLVIHFFSFRGRAFFERIILCNSLVWSCAITGRSGMTYQEAIECEEKAKRHLATFQESLQRPLLFMATLTHRSRLVDMNDDIFLFCKDRYFTGETVDVSLPGEPK